MANLGRLTGRLAESMEQLVGRVVSDKLYLRLRYRRLMGRWPNFRHPKTFNEHVHLYKLSTRGDPRFPRLADKLLVKEHVAAIVDPSHAVPTLWAGTMLPPRHQRCWPKPYVIKSNHACGQVIRVGAQTDPNWDVIESQMQDWLSSDYRAGRRDREWHYAHIERRVLVEPMLGDGVHAPFDYKLYVFGGRVEFITVDYGRFEDHCRCTFDRHWKAMPFEAGKKRGTCEPPQPAHLPQMIEISEKLGREFEFVRVDIYDVEGRLYVGEMTFFPGGGKVHWEPPVGDDILGSYWQQNALTQG